MTLFGTAFFTYLLILFFHEGAHTVAARVLTGKFLTFKFTVHQLFGIPCVPSFVWAMPETTEKNKRIIAEAGFTAEILTGAMMTLAQAQLGAFCVALTAVHFAAYPWYSEDSGDFKFL